MAKNEAVFMEELTVASNKTKMKNIAGRSGGSIGGVLLKIVAGGVAGGALLISGAKALGEALLDRQESDRMKLEERRSADMEEVRRIMANDPEAQD